jgi:hypothetical protein
MRALHRPFTELHGSGANDPPTLPGNRFFILATAWLRRPNTAPRRS